MRSTRAHYRSTWSRSSAMILHAYALVRARNTGIPSSRHRVESGGREPRSIRRAAIRGRKSRRARSRAAAGLDASALGFVRASLPGDAESSSRLSSARSIARRRRDAGRNAAFQPFAVRAPIRDALRVSSPWVGATLHRVTGATDRGPVLRANLCASEVEKRKKP